MKLLPRILNRIAFVRAEFTSADECRTEVFMWRSGILSPTGRATAKNALAVLVVCGQGVVTTPEGCQVVARVEADPETFLWSSAGGATSFVRRERLQSVLAVLAADTLLLGGALRWYLEKRKCGSEKEKNDSVQSGVLYSSGLIAGEGIVGILLAVLAIIPAGLDAAGKELYFSDKINLSGVFSIGNIGGLVCFAGILLTIYFFATKDSKKKSN